MSSVGQAWSWHVAVFDGVALKEFLCMLVMFFPPTSLTPRGPCHNWEEMFEPHHQHLFVAHADAIPPVLLLFAPSWSPNLGCSCFLGRFWADNTSNPGKRLSIGSYFPLDLSMAPNRAAPSLLPSRCRPCPQNQWDIANVDVRRVLDSLEGLRMFFSCFLLFVRCVF